MLELNIERDIALPIDRVFAAWTQPALLGRWFAPGEAMTCKAEAEVRVGGAYKITMHDPDTGEDHVVLGKYTAVEPNERLAFSWRWQSSDVTTQVEVRLESLGDTTRLRLRHTEFPDQTLCDKHSIGWNGCLSSLQSRTKLLRAEEAV